MSLEKRDARVQQKQPGWCENTQELPGEGEKGPPLTHTHNPQG